MYRFLLVFILVFSFTTVNAQNFSTHQVKEGESVEGIAKRYNVTALDIYNLNPDAKKKLKPNTILIIPISKAKKPKVTTVKVLTGFITHKTKRKETLYSLSEKYNLSEDEIKKYNTFLYAESLRKGDKLQIPIFKVSEVVETASLTKKYTVHPKEGKWRIAYKFGITTKELEALNPEMEEVLKDGQVINVPNINEEQEHKLDEQYSYYKVLPKEGFYRLKLKLGLEQAQLETLNPELKTSGLKEGMVLKIPQLHLVNDVLVNNLMPSNLEDSISNYNTKRIAIMLPFRLHRVDFDSISDTKKSMKKDPYLSASLDFYTGVLVALDSLKTLGLSLNIDVYDTKRQVSEVTKIIKENNFENVDAVIGPLTSNTFQEAALQLRPFNTPVVSPIGSKLKLYENVFQSKPSEELLKNKIINFVKANSLDTNIIIISDKASIDRSNMLKTEFTQAKQIYSHKNKNGADKFFVTKYDIEQVLRPGKNLVFLETTNDGFASNVVSILASRTQKINTESDSERVSITLTTTHYNKAFEGDDVSNWHLSKLQFYFASATKEYNFKEKNSFVEKYNSIYNITPSKRAVKGFDLTMDIVLRLVSSEDLYTSVKKNLLTEYVENKFRYKKNLFGGYYNDSVYLVKYDDLTIVEIK